MSASTERTQRLSCLLKVFSHGARQGNKKKIKSIKNNAFPLAFGLFAVRIEVSCDDDDDDNNNSNKKTTTTANLSTPKVNPHSKLRFPVSFRRMVTSLKGHV